MKHVLAAFLVLSSIMSAGQNLRTCEYGRHTLTGRVILKNLKHPVSGKTIENAMVLMLTQPVTFTPSAEDEDTTTTREVRIYGDVTKNVNPNIKYKSIIGKKVAITASFVFAPSGNYPLLVNIIEDFSYKIIK